MQTVTPMLRNVLGGGLGLVTGGLYARQLVRSSAERRMQVAAAGLVVAAAIYPAARTSWREPALGRELGWLAGFGALTAMSLRSGRAGSERLLAAGWLGHALFDARHDRGTHSLVPDWYPTACAAFDATVAAALASASARGT